MLNQYAHASGVVVSDAKGESRAILLWHRVCAARPALRIDRSGRRGESGSPVDQVSAALLPVRSEDGKYSAAVMKSLRLGGVVTVIGLAALLFALNRKAKGGRRGARPANYCFLPFGALLIPFRPESASSFAGEFRRALFHAGRHFGLFRRTDRRTGSLFRDQIPPTLAGRDSAKDHRFVPARSGLDRYPVSDLPGDFRLGSEPLLHGSTARRKRRWRSTSRPSNGCGGSARRRPARDQRTACALGRRVKLTMTSEDVIHSFFVPAFRVKADVLPGRGVTGSSGSRRPSPDAITSSAPNTAARTIRG